MNLLVDALLAILSAGGLTGGHRSVANAIGNAVLLVLASLPHFVVAVVRHVGVVLVLVDRMAQVVLLVVDLLALLLRQLAAVGLAVVLDLAIQVGFAPFQVLGFAGRELA